MKGLFFPIFILIFCVAMLVIGCSKSRSTVALMNDYRLERDSGRVIHLIAPDGKRLSADSISQFCVSGATVYGWIDGREAYFLLDTRTGQFQVFSSTRDLNRDLSHSGIPPLNMADSYTYWDIKDGHKTPAW